jgi:MOSC domain-containing protein YiiM
MERQSHSHQHFQTSCADKRRVTTLNIEGDEQSDLRVHGGINKAIYAYDVSHYEHWKKLLLRNDWTWGMFGENLTTEGLVDEDVKIGDVYQVGTAKLQVVQPRFPCMKLNVRFANPDMIGLFAVQRRNGIYFKVLEEGLMQVNDEIKQVEESAYNVTIQEYVNCYYEKGKPGHIRYIILSIPFLPESQRHAFESFQ